MTAQKEPTTSINLRLPQPMVEQLRALADADERSLNAMVQRLLRETLAQRGQ